MMWKKKIVNNYQVKKHKRFLNIVISNIFRDFSKKTLKNMYENLPIYIKTTHKEF